MNRYFKTITALAFFSAACIRPLGVSAASDSFFPDDMRLKRKGVPAPVKISAIAGDDGVFQSKVFRATVGNMMILVNGKVGSFRFYAIDKKGIPLPTLAGYDEFTSSFFSLKMKKKEYRLTNNIKITIGARRDADGAQLIYVIPKVARVLIKFECIKSDDNGKEDVVRVRASVQNLTGRTEEFALKNVLDTMLGETGGIHFATAEEAEIRGERQYRRFDGMKWVDSKNKRTAMRIFFDGADITAPEVVTLGNKDLLSLHSWIPAGITDRSFDSVVSYNNSAIAINWYPVRIEPQEMHEFIYYIALAADGKQCAGDDLIAKLEGRASASGGADADSDDARLNTDSLDTLTDYLEDKNADYAKIAALLERIAALEEDPDKINHEEIMSLNAEIDTILQGLGHKE